MKVLLTKKISDEMRKLFEGLDVTLCSVPDGDPEGFARELKDADALLLSTAYRMDAAAIAGAANLKVISRTGVGVDNVDVNAATARGIQVLNTPTANSLSVAEHAVTLMAALSKQLFYYGKELRTGNFKVRRENKCVDMDGKTLGLIGCGRIGRMVAAKCKAAFNMELIGYDPFISSDIDGIHILPNMDDVLKQADYISLHLPLTDETRGFINSEKLALLKPTAIIINTSRGGIINEADLAEALNAGRIAGAGIDVFASEPPEADNPLLTAENAILTPHSAALTKECSKRVLWDAITGIADFCKGARPQYIVNAKQLGL